MQPVCTIHKSNQTALHFVISVTSQLLLHQIYWPSAAAAQAYDTFCTHVHRHRRPLFARVCAVPLIRSDRFTSCNLIYLTTTAAPNLFARGWGCSGQTELRGIYFNFNSEFTQFSILHYCFVRRWASGSLIFIPIIQCPKIIFFFFFGEGAEKVEYNVISCNTVF